jgi:hypothetical protein
VIEVDVGDGDAGEVVRTDAELGESGEEGVDGALAARFDEHRALAFDEVAGGHPLPPPEEGVDLEHARGEADRHRPVLTATPEPEPTPERQLAT